MIAGFIVNYIKYYFTSASRYDVHSPFVYSLVDKVINARQQEPVFKIIEKERRQLRKNYSRIEVEDFGAGSSQVKLHNRTISTIAASSSKPKKYCELLFRIIKHYKPEYMLELGTSFGISALYQSAANPEGHMITLEGSSAITAIAEKTIRSTGLANIEVICGQFEITLLETLQRIPSLDYVFIDGNHQLKPTLFYFEQCLKHAHKETIFIFDDINWSKEMQEAWESIKSHPKTRVTIDLFMMGIVFLNPELSKENFIIRY